MLGQSVNWDYQWSQIVGRAWADDDFKQRLLAEPAVVLEEYDLAQPAGLRVEVHEEPAGAPPSTDDVLRLVLPAKPSEEELSEEDLCGVGGDGAFAYCWCRCRCGCGGCRCGRCGCHHPPKPDEEV
jgi:hypothetical protein